MTTATKKKVVKKKVASSASTHPADLPEKKPAVKKKTAKKKTAKKTPPTEVSEVDVPYPDIMVNVCAGEDALTPETAKKLLGWWEEPEGEDWGGDFLLRNTSGKKVRCTNNTGNRPLSLGLTQLYVQEILRKKWKLNLETIIIGRTGMVVEGQHRLIALALAEEQNEDPEETVSIETLVAFGCAEDDATVNTINTGKPRSLSDVIFRSELFADYTSTKKKSLARMLDHAVRFVWDRIGMSKAFDLRRTLSESMEFINNHPSLLRAAKHIFEEFDSETSVKYLSPGYASGMLFLMSACKSDPEVYRTANPPGETHLDLSQWDNACDYWTELLSGGKRVAAIKEEYQNLLEIGGGSLDERIGIIAKGWQLYVDDLPIEDVSLAHEFDDDGLRILLEYPTVGGIDNGPRRRIDTDPVITPDEVEEEPSEPAPPKKKAKKKIFTPKPGMVVTVVDTGGNWSGTVETVDVSDRIVSVKASDNGKVYPGIGWGEIELA